MANSNLYNIAKLMCDVRFCLSKFHDNGTANLPMMLFTPVRHPIQQLVWLINDQVRPLVIQTNKN